MPKYFFLFVGIAFILFTACARERVPFTQELRQEHQLSADDLTNLQYYVSDSVLLERVAPNPGDKITQGKLTQKKGVVVEEIVVKKETPGVATQSGDYWLEVGFEKEYGLYFTCKQGMKKEGSYYLGTRGNGKLQYAGNTYTIEEGIASYLLIDTKSLYETIQKRKILPGRWIPYESKDPQAKEK